MANAVAYFGLKPVRHLNGSPWNGQVVKCYIPSTDGNAMYMGDPVDLAGSGDTTGACATVALASMAATVPAVGVIVAFEPDPTDLTLTYRKASTNRYCYVCMSPDTIYEVCAGPTSAVPVTSIGLNAVMHSGSGSTVTGLSGMYMDDGTTTAPGANATYPLLILNAVAAPDNDVTLVNARFEVIISMHRLMPNYSNTAYFGALGIS